MTEPLISGHDAALGAIVVICALVALAIYGFIERELANKKGRRPVNVYQLSNNSAEFMNQLAEEFTRDPAPEAFRLAPWETRNIAGPDRGPAELVDEVHADAPLPLPLTA